MSAEEAMEVDRPNEDKVNILPTEDENIKSEKTTEKHVDSAKKIEHKHEKHISEKSEHKHKDKEHKSKKHSSFAIMDSSKSMSTSNEKSGHQQNRLWSEPVDREIDIGGFNIQDKNKVVDGALVNKKPDKRARCDISVPVLGMKVDVDPKYLKVFQKGWRRELVFRNPENEMAENPSYKPKADVYYFAPRGKKLRSLKEIENYIAEHPDEAGKITVDNFIFVKGSIYEAPEEVVRTAAGRGAGRQGDSPRRPGMAMAKKKLKEAVWGADRPGFKSAKEKLNKVKFKFQSPGSGNKNLKSGPQVAKKRTAPKKPAGPSNGTGGVRQTQRLCALNCPGQIGVQPSLTCDVCMCMYHPTCVGQYGVPPSMYICPNCTSNSGVSVLGQMANGAGSTSTHAIPPNIMSSLLPNQPISGQLLTLPSSVLSKVNSQEPLSLKVNNKKLVIPPNCFINTPDGVKVFLPAGVLPQSVFNTDNKALSMKFSVDDSNKQSLSIVAPDGDSGKTTPTDSVKESKVEEPVDTTNYLEKLHVGEDCLLHIFRYLPVRDLLRAAKTCTTWRKVADHQALWKAVSLNNSLVSQWENAVNTFNTRGTRTLDLRGMLFYEDRNRTWHQLTSVLPSMTQLRKIYLRYTPAHMLHTIADRLPDLETLVAEHIFDADQAYKPTVEQTTKLDIARLSKLTKLEELKIKSPNSLSLPPFSFTGGLEELSALKCIKTLSITTLRDVVASEFGFLASLTTLEDLELGDCVTFKEETYEGLGKLSNLKRLRLECGGEDSDAPLSEALINLTSIEQLELIKFPIGTKLKEALEKFQNLVKLIIWPDNTNQAASVNTNTLSAVSELTKLKFFEWAIMMDQGTSVMVDDNGKNDEKSYELTDADKKAQCIPFLSSKDENSDGTSMEVDLLPEYLTVGTLMERLCGYLPDTKVKVIRVPVINVKSHSS